MSTLVNNPNHSFVIQITDAMSRHAGYMRIDQVVAGKYDARTVERVRNQVQDRLNELHLKTRCHYLVIYEGNPEMASAILAAEQDCPF